MPFFLFLISLLAILLGFSSCNIYYRGPSGEVFGPYDVEQMQTWWQEGYFQNDLPVSDNPDVGWSTIRDFLPYPGSNEELVQMRGWAESYDDPYTQQAAWRRQDAEWGAEGLQNIKRNLVKDTVKTLKESLSSLKKRGHDLFSFRAPTWGGPREMEANRAWESQRRGTGYIDSQRGSSSGYEADKQPGVVDMTNSAEETAGITGRSPISPDDEERELLQTESNDTLPKIYVKGVIAPATSSFDRLTSNISGSNEKKVSDNGSQITGDVMGKVSFSEQDTTTFKSATDDALKEKLSDVRNVWGIDDLEDDYKENFVVSMINSFRLPRLRLGSLFSFIKSPFGLKKSREFSDWEKDWEPNYLLPKVTAVSTSLSPRRHFARVVNDIQSSVVTAAPINVIIVGVVTLVAQALFLCALVSMLLAFTHFSSSRSNLASVEISKIGLWSFLDNNQDAWELCTAKADYLGFSLGNAFGDILENVHSYSDIIDPSILFAAWNRIKDLVSASLCVLSSAFTRDHLSNYFRQEQIYLFGSAALLIASDLLRHAVLPSLKARVARALTKKADKAVNAPKDAYAGSSSFSVTIAYAILAGPHDTTALAAVDLLGLNSLCFVKVVLEFAVVAAMLYTIISGAATESAALAILATASGVSAIFSASLDVSTSRSVLVLQGVVMMALATVTLDAMRLSSVAQLVSPFTSILKFVSPYFPAFLRRVMGEGLAGLEVRSGMETAVLITLSVWPLLTWIQSTKMLTSARRLADFFS